MRQRWPRRAPLRLETSPRHDAKARACGTAPKNLSGRPPIRDGSTTLFSQVKRARSAHCQAVMIAFVAVRQGPQQALEELIHAVPRRRRTSVDGHGFTTTATRTANK